MLPARRERARSGLDLAPPDTLEVMRFRGPFPRLAALAIAVAVVGFLVVREDGRGAPGRALALRQNPAVGPFEGLGVWVDLYDAGAWSDPAAAVADMAAHGVKTLYLQTSNDQRPGAFVDPAGVAAFVDAGAADGVQVVAWYLPGLRQVATDLDRASQAIVFTTPAGNRFAAFALDIESQSVNDVALRSKRLLRLSRQLRAVAGDAYPLGAIVPSPLAMRHNRDYWPGFPWHPVSALYDAFLPMTYFTFRTSGEAGARAYAAGCIRLLRRWVGSDRVAIHMIGGLAQDASPEETRGFVTATRDAGLIGASYYTWPGISAAQWAALASVPSNPPGPPPSPSGTP
jgi:hypothetical protein